MPQTSVRAVSVSIIHNKFQYNPVRMHCVNNLVELHVFVAGNRNQKFTYIQNYQQQRTYRRVKHQVHHTSASTLPSQKTEFFCEKISFAKF